MASLETEEAWIVRVRRWRGQKDSYFQRDPKSPVPAQERDAFDGLEHYPPDPAWAVTGRARRVEEGEKHEADSAD